MSHISKSTGGYLMAGTSLVRSAKGAHTNALDRPISQTHLDALNAIQATRWRVNNYVLDVAQEVWTGSLRLAGLEKAYTRSVPDRVRLDLWADMTPEEQRGHRAKQAAAHIHNTKAQGRERALLETLTTAEELRRRDSIWFPHSLDFRGRIYPVTGGSLTPQGRDISKALLMFAEGMPLGPDGEFWLCVRAANCAGKDKRALGDRVGWALENRENIISSAADPVGHTWWADVAAKDEPWGLLATCHELAQAWDMENASDFVSHLPIPMDGSCSGIQHLSAMGLDPVGARSTNLCAGLARQDIYMDVAKLVQSAIEADKLAGVVEAFYWAPKVERATVKRSVMTTPYGVTGRGIQQQLVADGFCEDAEAGERTKLASYLRDKLVDALGATVVAAKEIMAWLQGVAATLADAQVDFRWTTPCGSQIRQAYFVTSEVRIQTLAGQFRLASDTQEGLLLKSKASSASAPNVVHSFDAAHMVFTVNTGTIAGITSWAMVHDSYGTHAGNTTRMNGILRDEFVRMYETDWLKAIYEEVLAYAPHVDIPPPPARGSFDLNEVRGSDFFFA